MERNKIPNEYKWNLCDIYNNIDLYKEDLIKIEKLSNDLSKYKGKILNNSSTLLEALNLKEKIDIIIDKLYVYINMKFHEDTRVSEYQEYTGNLDIILSKINEKLSFFIPELLKKDYKLIKKFISENKELERFEFLLENIYNEKKHILNKSIEAILSRAGTIFSSPDNIFNILNDADLIFGKIKDENNKLVQITQGNFKKYMNSKNRRVRKDTFNILYKKYKEFNNTISSIYNSNLQVVSFITKTRKYKKPINLFLDTYKIDTKIYYNLIKEVNNNLDKLHRYNLFKKNALKINELHYYDLLVNSFDDNKEYSYEDTKDLIKNALSVLGKDYIDDLSKAFNSSWVDVYENSGKRSGAYSWGCYSTHPFVLMNYQSKYNDVSTLAHEIGHAMHKYYSNNNQDYYYSDNAIFVAEIASTVNETLLNLYMLNNGSNKKRIINEILEDIRNTVFRQTMFAEFELESNNKSYNGETLSKDMLNNMYFNLVKKYNGNGLVYDDYVKYEWSRIPHFYSPFYVYQYATGYSIAFTIANKIYNGDKDMLSKYIEFLKSGSNDYPTNLVEKMGININEAIKLTLNKFGELLNEYEIDRNEQYE